MNGRVYARSPKTHNISTKAKLFRARSKWEDSGYRPDEYGHWLKGRWHPFAGPTSILSRQQGLILSSDGTATMQVKDIEDVALPLYQGGMINQFDFSASAYQKIEGKRGFKWTPISWEDKRIEPQYLMSRNDFLASGTSVQGMKLVFRNIARTTDSRTFIGAVINDLPTCHSIGLLRSSDSLLLASVLNSFTMDWVLRQRLAGTNLSLFVIQDLVAPRVAEMQELRFVAARLLLCHNRFAQQWTADLPRNYPWYSCWALTVHERLRCRAILEAAIAHLFHLDSAQFRHILADCDHPQSALQSSDLTRTLDPAGFWRYQKDQPPEHRLGVLCQVAYEALSRYGFKQFLGQNNGEGWTLPETLRLADYGLGHDERAKERQPVAMSLRPRFFPWQMEKSVKDSWEERECHADLLAKFLPPTRGNRATDVSDERTVPADLFGNPLETDLFGNAIYPKSRKR